jgi:hypothetical protein
LEDAVNRTVLVVRAIACFTLASVAGCGDDEGGDDGPMGSPPTFTEMSGLGLTGVWAGSLAWGDADNDGDLDLAVAGRDAGFGTITKVYRNNGAGGFSEFPGPSMTGVWSCSLAWGDADNDGDLDLAVAGDTAVGTSVRITKVYSNDGVGQFTETASLTGVSGCSLAWGDADNDGDLDLAVAGSTDSGRITTVYENDGAGGFSEFPGPSMMGVNVCSIAWGDYDNDGDLDLAVAGATDSGYTSTVYANDGAGGFAESSGPSLTGVAYCSLAWGDADNDGDLDLAVAGWTGSSYITRAYENDGAGGLLLSLILAGVRDCSVAWGDADNDGDLDLAIAGHCLGSGDIATVYENNGVWSFAEFTTVNLTGVRNCSLAWGDCDNDGNLDLAITGGLWDGAEVLVTKIYQNNGPLPNVLPTAPTGTEVLTGGGEAMFLWDEAADAETPAAGLSYNFRVGESPAASQDFPAMAAPDGWRRVPALGPVRPGISVSWHAIALDPGVYWFSVQAVDSSLAGGPWSEPVPFAVP